MDSAASNGVEATAGSSLAERERDFAEIFGKPFDDVDPAEDLRRSRERLSLTQEERQEWFASRTSQQLAGAGELARRGLPIGRRLLAQLHRQRDRLCARHGYDPAAVAEWYPLLAERIAGIEDTMARDRETLAYVRAHTPRPAPRSATPFLARIFARAAPRERRERRRGSRAAARAGPDPDLADEPEPPSQTGEAA